MEEADDMQKNLGNAIADLALADDDDDDDGEAAVMEDSDLEDEEDEVCSKVPDLRCISFPVLRHRQKSSQPLTAKM